MIKILWALQYFVLIYALVSTLRYAINLNMFSGMLGFFKRIIVCGVIFIFSALVFTKILSMTSVGASFASKFPIGVEFFYVDMAVIFGAVGVRLFTFKWRP